MARSRGHTAPKKGAAHVNRPSITVTQRKTANQGDTGTPATLKSQRHQQDEQVDHNAYLHPEHGVHHRRWQGRLGRIIQQIPAQHQRLHSSMSQLFREVVVAIATAAKRFRSAWLHMTSGFAVH